MSPSQAHACIDDSTFQQATGASRQARSNRGEADRSVIVYVGTRAQAAKMPMLAVTSTEVLEAMHHCMPSDA
jgi:hypothetical protein